MNTMRIFNPNPSHRVIADIEWEVTTDFIKADLIEMEADNDEPISHPINIKHKDFHAWLSKKEYMEWVHNTSDTVTGEHVQTTGKIGYIEYIQNNLTTDIIHEYLFETGKTTLALDKAQG